MAIPDHPPQDFNKDILTRVEMIQVQELFLDVFNTMVKSYVTEGDVSEITAHLAHMHANVRLHLLLLPNSVTAYTEQIFSNNLIRDFHLELSDRLSVEIAPIGTATYTRLVNTLVTGIVSSKSKDKQHQYSLRNIAPVLTSIDITMENARRSYFENPWLVGITLIALWFTKTTFAEPLRSIPGKLSTKQ